jgi:DNA modification methylase
LECKHLVRENHDVNQTSTLLGNKETTAHAKEGFKDRCPRCGAVRVDRQLGSERTPEEYIARMVVIFRELRRVLRDDGCCWLNMGDTYGGGGNTMGPGLVGSNAKKALLHDQYDRMRAAPTGLKSGNLLMIPHRLALGLQADGWVVRQDIVWGKPSPMPESVQNRCTKAHEYVFLLTKSMSYYYDNEAIKERSATAPHAPQNRKTPPTGMGGANNMGDPDKVWGDGLSNKRSVWEVDDGRALHDWLAQNHPDVLESYIGQASNRADVWRVSSGGYPGAHFAVFPPKLILPCILAGTSAYGACVKCGAPWGRVVASDRQPTRPGQNSKVNRAAEELKVNCTPGQNAVGKSSTLGNVVGNRDPQRHCTTTRTVGWRPGCACYGMPIIGDYPKEPTKGWGGRHDEDYVPPVQAAQSKSRPPAEDYDAKMARWEMDVAGWHGEWDLLWPQYRECQVRPCVVLDPFVGSGTTAVVCLETRRHCRGIDLSKKYLALNAVPRIEGVLGRSGKLSRLMPRPARRAVEMGGTEVGETPPSRCAQVADNVDNGVV